LNEQKSKKTALIVGASGLVGGHCLDMLLQDNYYDKVISIGRKALPISHKKLQQEIVDFDHLDKSINIINADHVFCCLGTTIKKAKTKDNFIKVDFTYPIKVAKISKQNGAESFSIITALGANKHSPIFYNKTKGEVEAALKEVGFDSLYFFRPSLLLGDRKESRAGEKIGIAVFKVAEPLFVGPFKKFKGIESSAIAFVMIMCAKKEESGLHIYESQTIQRIFNNAAR